MKTNLTLLVGLSAMLTVSVGTTFAQDVGLAVVYKQQRFLQTIEAAPVLSELKPPLSFAAIVEPALSGSISSATVSLAGGGERTLVYDTEEGDFSFEERFERLNDLHATYPNGNYTFHVDTLNDGPQSMSVSLSNESWPNPPRISNLAAFQQFDSSQAFVLSWDPMIGGAAADLILVGVHSRTSDNRFESPGPGEPGVLDGTATSIQIPAGTFSPGDVLAAELNFVRIVDEDPNYGITYAVYLSITDFFGGTSGGIDIIPPVLINSIPAVLQTNVDRGSLVSFTFSEPMRLGVSIAWTGISGNDVRYTRSPDRLTLFCHYATDFPAATLVGWTLNPPGSPMLLRDLAGNPAPTLEGSFTTSPDPAASGSDVDRFILAKGRIYTQSGEVTDALDLIAIVSDGRLRAANVVTNGIYTLPNARTIPIMFSEDHGSLSSEAEYVRQADLELFFPNGNFQMLLNTVHDGTQTVTLNVAGNTFPNAPTVIDLDTAQAIDPAVEFPLGWQPFVGGGTSDHIGLEIDNEHGYKIYETPDIGLPDALDGTSTGVVIPAGTLAAGRTYHGRLLFFHRTDDDFTSYPGARFLGGYFAFTDFSMATAGEIQPPILSVLPSDGTVFQMLISGEPGIPYSVESSFDLGSGFWGFMGHVWLDSGGDGVFSDPDMGVPGNRRFFRVREGF